MAAPAPKKALQVCIQHANMLPNVDGFLAGKSDAYVICHIQGKSKATIQTPVIQDNLNPVWNYTDVIRDYAPEDTLEFQVWDKNNFPVPDKKIGHVALTPADFAANPYGMEGALQLEDCKAQEATLTFQIHVVDDVDAQDAGVLAGAQATSAPVVQQAPVAQQQVESAQKFKLRVELLSAKMLSNKDSMLSGKSDPYAIAQIEGSGGLFKNTTKITTPVVNNNLNPEWNFCGDLPHATESDIVEFQVWDQDSFPKPDQLLGKARLPVQDVAANPSGLEGELPLVGTDGEDAGSLAIRVHALPDDTPAVSSGAAAPATTTTHAPLHATLSTNQVTIGQPYHGGVLVSEHWNPPMPTGFARPSVMPPATPRFVQSAVPMTTTPHAAIPMMSIPHGVPMSSLPYGVPAYAAAPVIASMPVVHAVPAPGSIVGTA
eukprot:TRINITY_DN45328_c0_g1_i1.p1 TRINITY_DN45328_c0_g1~~TRINITY_DN45328_c0_g1_i1.p1  ORF type:complete len:431 (-),score=96.67 TRINITY_DN45328_c0_g1_i1:156-1448(-)